MAKTYKNNWIKGLLANNQKPLIEIVEELKDPEFLNEAEIEWIAAARRVGCNLTNGTVGGDGAKGWIASEETRAKMSLASKGRKLSSETKEKISISKKGVPNLLLRNKPLSENTKRLLSESRLGKPGPKHTEETKLKISKAHMGKTGVKHTPEELVKMSRAHGGRPFIDELGNIYETQRQAANALGTSQAQIRRILSGLIKNSKFGHTLRYLDQ